MAKNAKAHKIEEENAGRATGPEETKGAGLILVLAFTVPLTILLLFVMLSDFMKC